MPIDINKHEVDIDTLIKQNENDLCSIKELYKKLKEIEEKIKQFNYIDSKLIDKIKKDYEKLKKVILDENIQVQLNNRIDEVNSELDTIDIKKANKDVVEAINSQLDKIETKLKKPFYPKFKGINMYVMNYTSNSTILSYLDDVAKNGLNAVFITAHNNYINGNFKPNLTDDQVIFAITEAKKRNIKPILKLHRMGSTETDNIASWITAWGIVVDKYVTLSKSYNIDTIVFCNEQDKFTKSNRNEWKTIIDKIKSNGLKVAISYRGMTEFHNSVLNDLVDIIGINYYPKMTLKGYDISDSDMLKKFYSFYNTINTIKHKYNKKIWISEIGCTRNIDALSNPSGWEFDTEEQSFIPQILYYKNLLKAYGESKDLNINGIFFWSTDSKDKLNSFTPFGNEKCENIIRSYEVSK